MLTERVIELSKIKIYLLTFGAAVFVVLGIWLVSMEVDTIKSSRRYNNPVLIYGLGVCTILLFGLFTFFGIKKLKDPSPGLIINSEGILDNSSAVSGGLVPWSDIVGIGEFKVRQQKFISIQVKDPERYAKRGNSIQRMANRANTKLCGTPVNISANSLKIDYKELIGTIGDFYQSNREVPDNQMPS